jgi:hypothetical protein
VKSLKTEINKNNGPRYSLSLSLSPRRETPLKMCPKEILTLGENLYYQYYPHITMITYITNITHISDFYNKTDITVITYITNITYNTDSSALQRPKRSHAYIS